MNNLSLPGAVWRRKAFALILVLIFAILPTATVLATEVSVEADSTAVKAGDNVTLTVVVSGDGLAAVQGAFSYDPAILTFVSGLGGASDGYISIVSAQKGGSPSLTAVVKFIAISAGEAPISVSIDSALDYNEQPLGTAQSAVNITVTGTAPLASGTDDESTPPPITVDYSQTGVPANNVDGATVPMYIWRSLTDLTLPSNYADKQVSYAGEFVGGAIIPDTDAPTLLYLSDAHGENAGYYIYDINHDTLYPYITLSSVLASFTLIKPDNGVMPPYGYEATTLELNDKQLPAWKLIGSDDAFYLVYARNSAGETGFYIYSKADKSVQRYIAPPAPIPAPTSQPENTPDKVSVITLSRTLLIALCSTTCALLLTTLYLIIWPPRRKKRRKKAKPQPPVSADQSS
ncbi:MAG: cohesin domain-containing protein [Clostridia bacterium]